MSDVVMGLFIYVQLRKQKYHYYLCFIDIVLPLSVIGDSELADKHGPFLKSAHGGLSPVDWDSHIVASLMQLRRDKAHSIDGNCASVGHNYG